jgi:Ser/Thr protein kinase RdoA (MazF antagonist)
MIKLIRETILPQYGIECKDAGLLSDQGEKVFHISDSAGQQFLLRLQDPLELSDHAIKAQLNWLHSILEETDLVVPRPIALESGKLFGEMEDSSTAESLRFVLYSWVEGERKSSPDQWVKHENLFLIGSTVAKMHIHSKAHEVPQSNEIPTLNSATFMGDKSFLFSDTIEPYLDHMDLQRFHRYIDEVSSALVEFVEIEAERGLIHADLGPQNWLFHNQKPALIDFDAFAVGYFIHDLLGVLWSHSHWDSNEIHLNSLFAGYESVRKIPDGVKKNVFLLQAAHCAMWINWVLSLKKNQEELRPHIPDQVRLLEKLCEKNLS